MFRETSGGFANPAVALATIIWQEFTLEVDPNNDFSQWAYEYASSFFLGPLCGGLLAGVLSNLMTHNAQEMLHYKSKKERKLQE